MATTELITEHTMRITHTQQVTEIMEPTMETMQLLHSITQSTGELSINPYDKKGPTQTWLGLW